MCTRSHRKPPLDLGVGLAMLFRQTPQKLPENGSYRLLNTTKKKSKSLKCLFKER